MRQRPSVTRARRRTGRGRARNPVRTGSFWRRPGRFRRGYLRPRARCSVVSQFLRRQGGGYLLRPGRAEPPARLARLGLSARLGCRLRLGLGTRLACGLRFGLAAPIRCGARLGLGVCFRCGISFRCGSSFGLGARPRLGARLGCGLSPSSVRHRFSFCQVRLGLSLRQVLPSLTFRRRLLRGALADAGLIAGASLIANPELTTGRRSAPGSWPISLGLAAWLRLAGNGRAVGRGRRAGHRRT